MVAGLTPLLLLGGAAVSVVGWLSTRTSVIARAASFVLGATIAMFCGFVVFALVADGGFGPELRMGGVLSPLAFAVIATDAVVSSWVGSAATLWRASYCGFR